MVRDVYIIIREYVKILWEDIVNTEGIVDIVMIQGSYVEEKIQKVGADLGTSVDLVIQDI